MFPFYHLILITTSTAVFKTKTITNLLYVKLRGIQTSFKTQYFFERYISQRQKLEIKQQTNETQKNALVICLCYSFVKRQTA